MTQKHVKQIRADLSTISADIALRIESDNELAIFQERYHSPERLEKAKKELNRYLSDRDSYIKYKLVSWAIRMGIYIPDTVRAPDDNETEEEKEARLISQSRDMRMLILLPQGNQADKDWLEAVRLISQSPNMRQSNQADKDWLEECKKILMEKREEILKGAYDAYVKKLASLEERDLARNRTLVEQLLLKRKVPGRSVLPDKLNSLADRLKYTGDQKAQFLSYTDPLYSKENHTLESTIAARKVYRSLSIHLARSQLQLPKNPLKSVLVEIRESPTQMEQYQANALAETLCTYIFRAGTSSADIGQGYVQQRDEVKNQIINKLVGSAPIQKNDILIFLFALLSRCWDERHLVIDSQKRLEQLLVNAKFLLKEAKMPGFKATERLELAMLIAIQSNDYIKLSMVFLLNA